MKVERSSRAGAARAAHGKKKGAADTRFVVSSAEAEGPPPSVSGLGPIAAVNALLAAQESGGRAARGQSSGFQSAEEMLDLLQQVQNGLLLGRIPGVDLRRLKTLMSERRRREDDPQLAQIIGDIELRAAVELAKLGYET